ncbi:MAG: M4 family metallopeptidase [Bacteroidetes bacterium]|nr:M4 family metallopeptidase [Bacteroidota bacterium]
MKRIFLLSGALFFLSTTQMFAQRNNSKISTIEVNPLDNTPTHITFTPTADLRLEKGADVLRDYLELNDPDIKMVFAKSTKPSSTLTVDRYTEYYKNIKVEHGTYTLMAKNGLVSFIHGTIFKPEKGLSPNPVLTENDALQKALDYTGASVYMWQDAATEKALKDRTKNSSATYFPKGTLVWVEDFSNAATDKHLHLAYSFDVFAKQPISRKKIYVDAVTGKILLTDAIIKHVTATGKSVYSDTVSFETDMSGSNYILMDNTRGGGVYTGSCHNGTSTTYDITNSTTTWPTSVALDAHWGATQVYDYWKTKHNRDSYDDFGSILNSYVNYSTNYNNAFWDGSEMIYGDGSGIVNGGFDPLTSLDVCGHEIGHGVCQYTASLVYQQESGAMNEGFSDIWGETIEHFAAPNKPQWQIGAEIGRVPLRSMSNPKLYNNPDTYNGTYWVFAGTGCNMSADNCGVHTNSGVLNKWYYLLTDGGSGTNDVGTAYQVAGIGLDKAADIAYATELTLASTDNYLACRVASIAVATTTYGACSPEVEAVTRAWRAVNVGTAYVACGAQIGFVNDDTVITKDAGTLACPASKTLDIPITVNAAPIGGSPSITVTASGTAVAGVDYTFVNNTATFPAASTSTQHIVLNILDHGSIAPDKTLILDFTVTPNGSNAIKGNIYYQYKIVITNNNTTPKVAGDVEYVTGNQNVITNISSPFFSQAQSARSQFIISAADLLASGLKPNTPITHINFNVIDKKSKRPFTGYTIKLGQTTQNSYSGAFLTGLTTVYSANYSTVAGWNKIPLTTTFQWDGTSNMICEVCFANTTASTDSTDRVAGRNMTNNITAYNFALTSTTGCALTYSGSRLSNSRPLVAFTQAIAATVVEKTAPTNRSWDMHTGQNVYYYNGANGNLMANIKGNTNDLGCVTASVSKQGAGFTPFNMDATVNRSVKEFIVTPTTNTVTTSHTTTLYFDTSELGSVNLANVRIVRTNMGIDTGMNTSNSQIVIPTTTTTPTYVGFTGSFTGFSRFYLIDKNYVLPAPPSTTIVNIEEAAEMHVDNNPFHDKIYVSYSINKATPAQINVYDITGKTIYTEQRTLSEHSHQFAIDLNSSALIPGHYILQVVTNTQNLRQKMVKE